MGGSQRQGQETYYTQLLMLKQCEDETFEMAGLPKSLGVSAQHGLYCA